jgi:deazaflavin-dependent oxidoreductase (nitroreductase family)
MTAFLRLLGTGRASPADDGGPGGARALKRRVSRAASKTLVNPVVRRVLERSPAVGWALLETTGRRTGLPRVVPVGNGLRGDDFWIVTEHGWGADYVRNIKSNPHVRVRVAGAWRPGTAEILTDADPYAVLRWLRRPVNDAALLALGTQQLVIRVRLAAAGR